MPNALRSHGAQPLRPLHVVPQTSPAVVFVDCDHADAVSELGKLRAENGPRHYLVPVLERLTPMDVISLVTHGANDAACHADLDAPGPIITRAKDETRLMHLVGEGCADLPRLLSLGRDLNSPVFFKDAEGIYTGCNSRFEEFVGLGEEWLGGKTVYDIAPSDLALTYHRADLDLLGRGGIQIYATGMRHATRGVRTVRFYKSALHDSEGRIVGIVGTLREIGDAKSHAALRAEFDALAHAGGACLEPCPQARPGADPDRRLVERIAAGEPAALARLYSLHRCRLERFLGRLSANETLMEEVVNDTFLAIWNKAGEFRGECAVSTWMMAIAYRCALKALRGKRHLHLEVELTHADSLLQYWHDHETSDLLSKAFDLLPEDLRLAMSLAYLFGHSIEEIAQITAYPVTTVKARLHRARARLRTTLTMLGQPT